MWFRRKNKSDPDTALTDTLMSLQSLLDDEKPNSTTSALSIPESAATTVTDNTLDFVNPGSAEENNIKNAVASDEHLEWDFKVDLASDDTAEKAPGSAFLKTVESNEFPELEVPKFGEVVPILREQKRKPGTEMAVPQSESAEDIPVLNNIVDLPGQDFTDRGQKEEDETETPFVEQCLKDIRKRLKRNELTPLTEDQENHFRAVLTSLRLQKTSGKFE